MNDGGWMALCRLGTQTLTLGRWRQELAGAFRVFRPWLVKTGRPVGHVKRGRCGCLHRVLADEDGDGFRAVCTCGAGGESVRMTEWQARAWQVDGRAVVEAIAAKLPVEVCVKVVGRHLLWEIGTGWTRAGGRRRVLVSLAGKRAVLEAGLGDLFTHGMKDFVLLVADPAWCGSDIGPRLESVGGEIHALGGFVTVGRAGLTRGSMVERVLEDERQGAGFRVQGEKARSYTLRRRGVKQVGGVRGKPKMDLWAIRYEGGEFDLPDVLGSEYLVWLLLHPARDRVFEAGQLIAAVTRPGGPAVAPTDAQVKDAVFDSEGQLRMAMRWQPDVAQAVLEVEDIEHLEGMVKAVGIALREAMKDLGRADEVEELKGKRDDLLAYLEKSTRPGPRGKRLPVGFAGGSGAKQADLVRRHLGKVVRHVRGLDRAFFGHLNDRAIFRYGEQNYYRPPRGVAWQVIP